MRGGVREEEVLRGVMRGNKVLVREGDVSRGVIGGGVREMEVWRGGIRYGKGCRKGGE